MNIADQILSCEWATSKYFIFSDNVFASLIYYSHLTPIVLAFVIGLFVFLSDSKSLVNKVLFCLTTLFSFWTLFDLILWAHEGPKYIMFFWSLLILFEPIIYAVCLYFLYVYVTKKAPPLVAQMVLFVVLLPTIALTSTDYSILGFNLTNCDREVIEGILVYYGYAVELLITLWILVYSVYAAKKYELIRKQILFVTSGLILFLLAFASGNIAGSFSENWTIGQYGLFGMPIFVAFLGYLIVRFKAFNMKVIATQAIVAALWFLTFAILFLRKIESVRAIVIITLVLFTILGMSLIRSVKREIEAKEKVEKLAGELEQANIQQESLIRFIGHEMKGYLTTSAGVFASIVEGDFNPISDTLKSSAESALTRVREGVRSVVEILSNANAKKGTLTYKMQSFDFGKVVLESIAKLSPDAQEKGLTIETSIKDDATYRVMGDIDQLSEHVVRNLIDNSIKYTPTGSVHIELSKSGGKVLLSIRDTGVGITAEDKVRLFTEGGRGKNSLATNVHSTGYGLAIAKKIVDAHSGRIWAESDGQGKGSQFYVELPEAK